MVDRFRPLRDFAELISGQHVNASEVLDDLSETPYLTGPSDFDRLRPTTRRSTSAATAFAEPGDLLITVKGSGVGSYAFAERRYAISRQLMAIRAREPNCAEFVFQSVKWHASALASASQGTIPGLSREDILSVLVADVSLSEQHKIAEILRTWDEAIENLEALRATKENLTSAIADDLIFGVRRIAGYQDPWASRRLAEITRELTRRNRDGALGRDLVMGVTNSRGIVPMREQTIAADISRYLILPPRALTKAQSTKQIDDFVKAVVEGA